MNKWNNGAAQKATVICNGVLIAVTLGAIYSAAPSIPVKIEPFFRRPRVSQTGQLWISETDQSSTVAELWTYGRSEDVHPSLAAVAVDDAAADDVRQRR